jgi:hypothetical protein
MTTKAQQKGSRLSYYLQKRRLAHLDTGGLLVSDYQLNPESSDDSGSPRGPYRSAYWPIGGYLDRVILWQT